MSVYLDTKGLRLLLGDCCEVLAEELDGAAVDAVVTDPPYELGFMGKAWDGQGVAYSVDLWRSVLNALKPGGHLLAFGGTRTYHRMTCAIEDAGFQIRDSLHWIYGSGFPKSLDVSKAIDRAAGAEREVVGVHHRHGGGSPCSGSMSGDLGTASELPLTTPSTAAAKQWEGWGTALKPGHEPIVLARKPLTGTVAANILAHGTGALNIDGCRIEGALGGDPNRFAKSSGNAFVAGYATPPVVRADGRWPANVLLDPAAAAELDRMSGERSSRDGNGTGRVGRSLGYHGTTGEAAHAPGYGDGGGASRFFYVAKPSRAERDIGCEGLEPHGGGEATDREEGSAGLDSPRAGAGRGGGARNHHPTVKPVELMRYLVRLVTPPRGVVLDPFMGSGTTAFAAWLEHRDFIGIERDEQYMAIAARRAKARAAQGNLWEPQSQGAL